MRSGIFVILMLLSASIQAQIKKLETDTINHSNRNEVFNRGGNRHFPYPIIFIHGLGGDWYSWGELGDMLFDAGFSYGGQIGFCLNQDGDLSIASYSNDIGYNPNLVLPNADFYDINFNCNPDGFCFSQEFDGIQNYVQSNQAAICKQGIALSIAINQVLNSTNANKVILMGHSMGGLCAREYLQNSYLWPDEDHHVAKYISSGTPHGGSNATLLDLIPNIDEKSEAVRDLRESYTFSSTVGAYLYGGFESFVTMQNSFLWNYYNVDVNCNGILNNTIIGLNVKSLPTNLDFAIIRSDWNWLLNGGDGVVDDYNADLTNYYSNIPDYEKFWSTDNDNNGHSDFNHIEMPEDFWVNMHSLDEPDDFHLSYDIESNKTYAGFITIQGENANYLIDYDDYKITLVEPGNLSISVLNLLNNGEVSIYDIQNQAYIYNQVSNGDSQLLTDIITLNSGEYIIEISGAPFWESWLTPYVFEVNFTPIIITTTAPFTENKINIYPNPAKENISVEIKSEKNLDNFAYQITDLRGRQILKGNCNGVNQILINELTSGIYLLKVYWEGNVSIVKFIKSE